MSYRTLLSRNYANCFSIKFIDRNNSKKLMGKLLKAIAR